MSAIGLVGEERDVRWVDSKAPRDAFPRFRYRVESNTGSGHDVGFRYWFFRFNEKDCGRLAEIVSIQCSIDR